MISAFALVAQVNQVTGVLIAVAALVSQFLPIICIRRVGEKDTETNQHAQHQRAHSSPLSFQPKRVAKKRNCLEA